MLHNLAAEVENQGATSSVATGEMLHGSTKVLFDRVPWLEHGPDTSSIGGAQVHDCMLLPDGTICFSIPENRRLLRIDSEGNALGALSFESIWPRALAVSSAGLYFTTMPPNVNYEEAPDYPSTRVARVPLRRLLDSTVDAASACNDFVLLQFYEVKDHEDEEDVGVEDDPYDAELEVSPGSPIAIAAEGSRTFVLHRIIKGGARPWEYRDDDYLDWSVAQCRASPTREAFISVFDRSAVRPSATFSLGERSVYKKPEQVVPFRGLLYINCIQHVDVCDTHGHFLRCFKLDESPNLDHLNPNASFMMAIANDRLYARRMDMLRVCDLNGELLQAVESPMPRAIEASATQPFMSGGGSWTGLCVNEQHAIFFMQMRFRRPDQPRTRDGPFHRTAVRVLGVRSLHET